MIPENFVAPCANSELSMFELEENINKFGALLTLIFNKPISCVSMFILIRKHPELRDLLINMTDTSWYSIVEYLAYRYPVLNKSKKIK